MWIVEYFPIFSTLAAFYVDVICTYAFYHYINTLVLVVKNGSVNVSYFSDLLSNPQLLPIFNFYVLIVFSAIILIFLLLHWPAKMFFNVGFHKHYIQHFLLFRVLYLVIIGMYLHEGPIKHNLFTDIVCVLTALVNVSLCLLKFFVADTKTPIATDPNSPIPPGGDITNVSRGFYIAQIIVSLLSLALCLTALIDNRRRRKRIGANNPKHGSYGYMYQYA